MVTHWYIVSHNYTANVHMPVNNLDSIWVWVHHLLKSSLNIWHNLVGYLIGFFRVRGLRQGSLWNIWRVVTLLGFRLFVLACGFIRMKHALLGLDLLLLLFKGLFVIFSKNEVKRQKICLWNARIGYTDLFFYSNIENIYNWYRSYDYRLAFC